MFRVGCNVQTFEYKLLKTNADAVLFGCLLCTLRYFNPEFFLSWQFISFAFTFMHLADAKMQKMNKAISQKPNNLRTSPMAVKMAEKIHLNSLLKNY